MSRAPSALMAIGGFGVAVAALSVASTAAIILLAPAPPPVRIKGSEAAAALRGPTPAFDRYIAAKPPQGTRATMLEGPIAAELRKAPTDVQVTWPEDTRDPIEDSPGARVGTVLPGANSLPASFTLVQRGPGQFQLVPPGQESAEVRKMLLNQSMPAFGAGVRQPDGRWLIVEPARPFLAGWQRNILVALALSLLLPAPLAWVFARRLTRPFRALADALDDTADPLPQDGPRELREAAAAIAAMRQRLANEAPERARMLTAVAHDMRTPLTGLRLRIETATEPQRSRMVADVERMQAMIGEVLSFARDAAAPPDLLEVRSVLAAIAEEMTTEAAEVCVASGEETLILVPEPAFRRAVENLVRNAIDYAAGGTLAVHRRDGSVTVSVADAGPGIPAAERERLLLPFERGDASRSRDMGGSGLGLSIVRDFAARYHGSFALLDAPGGGTVAALTLPPLPRGNSGAAQIVAPADQGTPKLRNDGDPS